MARKAAKDPAVIETDDLLATARKEYELCREAWHENQEQARLDLRFARLGEQWPVEVERQRRRENRPA
jgi:hypothetical protein